MKFMVIGSMPTEAGNRLIKSGKLASTMQAMLESIKPEAVYFTERNGKRTVFMIVEMHDASQIPAIAEPMFLGFDGEVEFHPVMLPADLQKAGPGIEAAVKKFGS